MANEYVSKVVLSNGTTLIDLTGDTVTAADLLSGVTAHDKSGATITGTCSYDSDTSDDTAAVSEILSGKTAHARGALLTGTMTNVGAQTGSITAKAQQVTIAQGYHDGSGKVSIASAEQAKIIATNIREGITILGVQGTMSGSEGVVAQAKTATPSWSQQVISPDTGYTHLSQVTVAAIPIAYSDNSAGGQTVTIG
jgi:hypothetical protein